MGRGCSCTQGDPGASCCTCVKRSTGSVPTNCPVSCSGIPLHHHLQPMLLPLFSLREKEGLEGRGWTFSIPSALDKEAAYPWYHPSGQFLALGTSREPRNPARNTKGFSSLMRRHL